MAVVAGASSVPAAPHNVTQVQRADSLPGANFALSHRPPTALRLDLAFREMARGRPGR